jgi:hypothetical protein
LNEDQNKKQQMQNKQAPSYLSAELRHALGTSDADTAITLIDRDFNDPQQLTEILDYFMSPDWRTCQYTRLGTWRIIIYLMRRGAKEMKYGNDLIFVVFGSTLKYYIIDELKKVGLDINARWSQTNRSLMAEAYLKCDIDTIKYLVSIGVKIDDTVLAEPWNDTSSYGISSGEANREFLIQNGWTDPEHILRMLRCQCMQISEISKLAKYIPINTRLASVKNGTMLHFLASKHKCRHDVLHERIEEGEDIFAVDDNNDTFVSLTDLEYACDYSSECHRRFKLANALLKRCILLNKIDSNLTLQEQIKKTCELFGITPNWFVDEPDPIHLQSQYKSRYFVLHPATYRFCI